MFSRNVGTFLAVTRRDLAENNNLHAFIISIVYIRNAANCNPVTLDNSLFTE